MKREKRWSWWRFKRKVFGSVYASVIFSWINLGMLKLSYLDTVRYNVENIATLRSRQKSPYVYFKQGEFDVKFVHVTIAILSILLKF